MNATRFGKHIRGFLNRKDPEKYLWLKYMILLVAATVVIGKVYVEHRIEEAAVTHIEETQADLDFGPLRALFADHELWFYKILHLPGQDAIILINLKKEVVILFFDNSNPDDCEGIYDDI